MTKSWLKKSVLKFRQYHGVKREVGPTRRPKNLLCHNLKTKVRPFDVTHFDVTHSTLPKNIESRYKVYKQNVTNANQTYTTSSEEVKVRKQAEEVNKCPSVLRKSVSW